MIIRKSQSEIERMAEAGAVVARTLEQLGDLIRPGVTTAELDRAAEEFIRSQGGVPTFLGYRGAVSPFPASICTSPNAMVVHGIPGGYRPGAGQRLSVRARVTPRGRRAD